MIDLFHHNGEKKGQTMRDKLRKWAIFLWLLVKRYIPLEISGTITAVAAGMVVFQTTGNMVLAAVAATWSENVGFYGMAAFIEARGHYKEHNGGFASHVKIFFKTLRNLVTEFGLAEAGDTLLVRPAMMVLFQVLLGGGGLGIFVGKLAADVLFYGLAAVGFCIRKYLFEKEK